MGKIAWLFMSMILASQVFSNGLDKVEFQLSDKQWVKTHTALLQVHISATLNDADVVKARASIETNLGKIASSQWQITQFDRNQDESGLAKLDVQAQARVPVEQLNNVYTQAEKVSRPGENYTIQQVDFKPSFQELQLAKNQLRASLYKQVSQEIENLNQAFPAQHYSVHQLEFTEVVNTMVSESRSQTVMLNALPQASPNVNVSNEISLTVLVDVASNRKDNKVGAKDEN